MAWNSFVHMLDQNFIILCSNIMFFSNSTRTLCILGNSYTIMLKPTWLLFISIYFPVSYSWMMISNSLWAEASFFEKTHDPSSWVQVEHKRHEHSHSHQFRSWGLARWGEALFWQVHGAMSWLRVGWAPCACGLCVGAVAMPGGLRSGMVTRT